MAERKIDATIYVTHLLGLQDLEKVLLLSGVPAFESARNIATTKGEDFPEFLNADTLHLEECEATEQEVDAFKGSILKALVIPYFPKEQYIMPPSDMAFKERKETLTRSVH
jgi:hypothetical protein